MASQLSLQEVLNALGGPLAENSLWALLHQSCGTLMKAIQESDRIPTLLITPESLLLSHGGSVQMLPGIPQSTSDFSAPEQYYSNDQANIEKCYVYSLGMTLLAAMRNELEVPMIPKVSQLQHKLLVSMTNTKSDQRPSLDEVLQHCNSHFESPHHAREEVDKLVSYVLGSSHDAYSDFEDYKMDEADLEAEIQQVINMRGTGSVENLYPPSYGSRGSSSLSLSSSGAYQGSFSVNPPGMDDRETKKMYSSLPMVFAPSTTHDSSSVRYNRSDNRLELSSSFQEKHGRQAPVESKVGYGSHFYTPLRGRRLPPEKKAKGSNHRKQSPLRVSVYRSSSDGRRKSRESDSLVNTPTLLVDDIPPLPPKSGEIMGSEVSDASSSEVSSLKNENSPPTGGIRADPSYNMEDPSLQDRSSVLASSFDYSVADTSLLSESNDSHSDSFNFPSPPPPPAPLADPPPSPPLPYPSANDDSPPSHPASSPDDSPLPPSPPTPLADSSPPPSPPTPLADSSPPPSPPTPVSKYSPPPPVAKYSPLSSPPTPLADSSPPLSPPTPVSKYSPPPPVAKYSPLSSPPTPLADSSPPPSPPPPVSKYSPPPFVSKYSPPPPVAKYSPLPSPPTPLADSSPPPSPPPPVANRSRPLPSPPPPPSYHAFLANISGDSKSGRSSEGTTTSILAASNSAPQEFGSTSAPTRDVSVNDLPIKSDQPVAQDPRLPNDSSRDNDDRMDSVAKSSSGKSASMKKLSTVLGPEFIAINGLQEPKSAERPISKIPTDRRSVEVVLLNNCTIRFTVELSSTCRELFNQVIAHLSLEETHIFGLTVIAGGSELFMEFDSKLLNHAPDGWREKSAPSASKRKRSSPFTVFFRVKYYVENVNQLRLRQTQHLYYLQLRKNVLEAKLYCHEQSALKLAAYSLQAEIGDRRNTDNQLYFRIENYLPSKAISKLGIPVIQRILPSMHGELKGQNREMAELNYLKEAQTLSEYGMVFYKVAREKKGKIGSIWLGLSVRGLVVYHVHKGTKTPSSHWPWKKIKNLSFANRKFLVEVEDGTTLSFYTESYKKAQYLLHLSINYHRFQLLPSLASSPPPYSDNDAFRLPITPAYIDKSETSPVQKESETREMGNEQGVGDHVSPHGQLPDGSSFSVEFEKSGGTIGLRLAGGKNKMIGRGFIYVKSINEGSIADRSGSVKEMDLLLQVNKQQIHRITHKETAAIILSSTSPVTMLFHRPHDPNWSEKQYDHPDSMVPRDDSWSDLTVASGSAARPTLNSITEEILAEYRH